MSLAVLLLLGYFLPPPPPTPPAICDLAPTSCIAFPDDGAAKRFAHMFEGLGYHTVICGKVR